MTAGCYQDSPQPDEQKAVSQLIALLDDKDVVVRRNAAEALGKIGNLKSEPFLVEKLKDPDPMMREAAARSLSWIAGFDPETRIKLMILLNDPDTSVRRAVAQVLGTPQGPRN